MQRAYDILAFVQAAWPTLAVIAVVFMGLIFIARTPGGRLKIIDLALVIISRIITAGVATRSIDKLNNTAGNLEYKLPVAVRRAREQAKSPNVRTWK